MAEEDDDDIAEEEQPGEGGRKKLILIGAGVLIVLLAVGGGTFWMLSGSDASESLADGEEAVEVEAPDQKAIYHKLKPKFVTTFDVNNRQHYLQVEVTLVTREESVVKALVSHQPLVRNALVMLMAEQDYLVLQTEEGKIALRESAVSAVQGILQQEIGTPGIERVLFTEFVMQ